MVVFFFFFFKKKKKKNFPSILINTLLICTGKKRKRKINRNPRLMEPLIEKETDLVVPKGGTAYPPFRHEDVTPLSPPSKNYIHTQFGLLSKTFRITYHTHPIHRITDSEGESRPKQLSKGAKMVRESTYLLACASEDIKL